jgi:dTDP-4-dehydrorhamnose reductase
MKKKVLITGGSGLLALNWAASQRERFAITLGLHSRIVSLAGVDARTVDLESTNGVARALDEFSPDLVIHAAGFTSVEGCETDPAQAYSANVALAERIADACALRTIALAHISTDHLFSGDLSLLGEDQIPAPVNIYGRTKAEAERRVMAAHPAALIVRTNFYGWGPSYRRSFSDTIITALRAGQEVHLFRDVYYTPILAHALIDAVHELLSLAQTGVFHVVGDERISKFRFGQELASVFGLSADLIKPALISERRGLVQRPSDMSLANGRACTVLGRSLGSVRDHLETLYRQEQNGLSLEIQKL